MRDDDLRVLLEDRGNAQEGQVAFDVIDALERVGHDRVHAPSQEKLRGILLGTTHAHLAVDAVFLVDAVDGGEIEAAVLALGPPVGLIADLVERLRGDTRARHRHQRGGGRAAHEQRLAAVDPVLRHGHGRLPLVA
jgi:hypothetical protein